jgi:hypothetical protein
VDDQDWTELTLEAFPHSPSSGKGESTTERTLFNKGDSASTTIAMTTTTSTYGAASSVAMKITPSTNGEARAWVVRLHLQRGQRVSSALADGVQLAIDSGDNGVEHIAPTPAGASYTPFGGKGTAPAPMAGHVAEVRLPIGASHRELVLQIGPPGA